MGEAYILTSQEFLALAAKAGIDRCQFLHRTDVQPFSRKESIDILFSLTRKGFVETEGETFRMTDPVAAVFAVIRRAEAVLFCTYQTHEAPTRLFYVAGGQTASLQQTSTAENMFRLQMIPTEEIVNVIRDDGQLPSEILQGTAEVGETPDTGKIITAGETTETRETTKTVETDETPVSISARDPADGEERESLRVIRDGVAYRIVGAAQGSGKEKVLAYSEDIFLRELRKMIGRRCI